MRISLENRGIAVAILGCAIFILGLLLADGILLALAGSVGILFLISWQLGKRNVSHLTITVQGTECSQVGHKLRALIRVENKKRIIDATGLKLQLQGAGALRLNTSLPWIPAASGAEVEVQGKLMQRGAEQRAKWSIQSNFPFGWLSFEKDGLASWPLSVLPKKSSVFLASQEFLREETGNSAVNAPHPGFYEWQGIREYRAGDSRRDIAWGISARALARGGNLLVKERGSPPTMIEEVTLVFHSAGAHRAMIRPHLFEQALSQFWGESCRFIEHGVKIKWLSDFDDWNLRSISDSQDLGAAGLLLASISRASDTEPHELADHLSQVAGLLYLFSDTPLENWQGAIPESIIQRSQLVPILNTRSNFKRREGKI